MCGICGTIGLADESLIAKMCQVMAHRGPDHEGYYLDNQAKVALGVRRLSIIDLVSGHQPIHNEDKSIWIVFNGEIYNFDELRKLLERKGHHFYTRSDTETIVHLYEEYGQACVHILRGMFAFAIWDKNKEKLFLARDRLGIKPLYYCEKNGHLIFASEIKAILEHPNVFREVDLEALELYLTLQYVPAPLTMFAGIRKLPPGHFMIWDKSGLRIERYWDVTFLDNERKVNEQDAAEELKRQLQEAVQLRLIADVPLGALLSGGIDSGTVVGLMAQASNTAVKTFTVGFDVGGWYNELEEARLVAKRFGTDHHEMILSAPQVEELLPKLIWHLDEPLADRAALPTYLICEFARSYVKVVLTGEGGDELFGGYPRYGWFRTAERLQNILPSFARNGLLRMIETAPVGETQKRYARLLLANSSRGGRHLSWVGNFDLEQMKSLHGDRVTMIGNGNGAAEETVSQYLRQVSSDDLIHALMYLDVKTWLVDDILTKVDKMSMATSLEARVPFLDHKLVEFVATLPSNLKVKGLQTKRLLKKTMDGFLPSPILNRKKHAFQVPAAEWFRGGLKDFVQETLLSETFARRPYFNSKYVRWIVEEHFQGRKDFNQQIWNLLCFELWHRMFIDGEGKNVL